MLQGCTLRKNECTEHGNVADRHYVDVVTLLLFMALLARMNVQNMATLQTNRMSMLLGFFLLKVYRYLHLSALPLGSHKLYPLPVVSHASYSVSTLSMFRATLCIAQILHVRGLVNIVQLRCFLFVFSLVFLQICRMRLH